MRCKCNNIMRKYRLDDNAIYQLYSEIHRILISGTSISRDYEVPEIAGYNTTGKQLYIDSRVPITVAGIDSTFPLAVHEETERHIELKLGLSYAHAHAIALQVERLVVENLGGNWEQYSREMDDIIRRLENTADPSKIPDDLIDPNTVTGV